MTLNISKTLLTLSAAILLAAAFGTSSNARPHSNRLSAIQSEPLYYHSDSDSRTGRDGSCFSRFTGLPEQYACSPNGG